MSATESTEPRPESERCPADDLQRAPEAAPGDVQWTPEAEARVARAPMFLRGMVRRLAEKRARAEGIWVITPELMTRYKTEMMGLAASGGYQVPAEAVPWTPEAQALLDAVPPFMRPMTRRICEELAAEHGAAAVTPGLIREAEAEAETEAAAMPLSWTPEAEARLVNRLGKAPAMMADFVLRLFRRDVEVEARRAGSTGSRPTSSTGSGRRRPTRRCAGDRRRGPGSRPRRSSCARESGRRPSGAPVGWGSPRSPRRSSPGSGTRP